MNDIDLLIKNLLKHAQRPEWIDLFHGVQGEYLTFAGALMELDPDPFAELIETQGWWPNLFGLVFEDFMARPLESAPAVNFALAYLKRAGWRETPHARRYLQALAESQPSLYEVLEVKPDEGLLLQDRLNDREPVWVMEKAATHGMNRWDLLYARIVRPMPGEEAILTGGVLRFTPAEGSELLAMIETMRGEHPEGTEVPRLALMAFAHWILRASAQLIDIPVILNREGHELLFCEARIPLRILPKAAEQRLDAAKTWTRHEPGEPIWQRVAAPTTRHGFDALDEQGRMLIASLTLEGRHLLLNTNSEERLQQALGELTTLLGHDAMGKPAVKRTRLDAIRESASHAEPGEPEIPDEEFQSMQKDFMDRHYRRVLRERIPMLDDKTPRMALRTKSGRKKVIEWLKVIENSAQAQGYDASWMWAELGLANTEIGIEPVENRPAATDEIDARSSGTSVEP